MSSEIGINWIDDISLEIQNEVETPPSWIWWSLVCSISAAAGNNYYVLGFKGNHVYKPNLYVMLLGDSGRGKAFGINLAKQLVTAADVTRVIAGRSSIQAIMTDLSTQKSRPDGKPPIADSRGFIVNGELSAAIISDVSSLAILTDLYDGSVNAAWENNLKMGKEKLKEPYITALFGSSPAHFYHTIPQANIEGGYIGRNLIVYEEKRARIVDPFGDENEAVVDKIKDYLIPKYVPHLESLAKMKGRMLFNPDARVKINSWRRVWKNTKHNDKTGFIERVPDHVVKVAMCLSLARYSSGGIIIEQDVDDAIDRVTGLIYANKMTTEGRGLDPSAGQSKLVLDILIRAEDNKMSRKRMLTQGHGNFDSFSLDKIMETLTEMGYVTKERYVAGSASDWIYSLAGEPLRAYLNWKGGNKK